MKDNVAQDHVTSLEKVKQFMLPIFLRSVYFRQDHKMKFIGDLKYVEQLP